MFFSGDLSSTRKRVDLGGKSSKERDRKKLLEQTRLDRNRRLAQRQQNSAALKIQKCYRGRKVVAAERARVRKEFFATYGNHFQNVNRLCFEADSNFLRQLMFFFNPLKAADFSTFVDTCRCLLQYGQEIENTVSLFAGIEYASNQALVGHRVRQLTYNCIWAVHQNRNQLKEQLFLVPDNHSSPTIILLETVGMLVDTRLPWSCKTVGYLLQRNVYTLFRDIILTGKENIRSEDSFRKPSSLESVLSCIMSHVGERSCLCSRIDPQWSFSSQILTIPLLWNLTPYLKEVFATHGLVEHYIHQMSLCVQDHVSVLPKDVSNTYPGCACLLGNLLETVAISFSQPGCSFDMAIDFAAVAAFLLEALPPLQSSNKDMKENDDEMLIDDEPNKKGLSMDLEGQIITTIDRRFLQEMTNLLFGGISQVNGSFSERSQGKEMAAVGAACAFLHVTFNILPVDSTMTVLAYRTELVPILWKFMKRCHETQNWSALSRHLTYLPADSPGWLLPLSVFCPVYKHMLIVVHNEEFYEQEKPLSLKDMKCLIVILRQALWQLLWVNPSAPPNLFEPTADVFSLKKSSLEFTQHRVALVTSDLLSQLQDWNNRRQFTSPSDFHADGVNEHFISQAMTENTKAHEILKHAPFLVPFTCRVKIYNVVAARQRNGLHAAFARNRIKVRRDHILEDSFNQLSSLSEEDLRGQIRITFVNEFGAEEAGIDGGGIFKDFMENVTRAAFDVQYGLFKETTDHLLYPNPGSGMIHEQHLQFFHFLGTVLAKAMFEGILVDIPFATFFLSKLKQKYNYLNDLPSLDPELYRHLIFLKHFKGDFSELELYFVVVNNEYGEQTEEELLPGGRNMRVKDDNVITFIHLIANHRLNFQIRQQSSQFLKGFQQLIQKDWIDMFNEHELQLLISGSVDGFDIDDLRAHANYAGGYHSDHYVIDMLWEVLKSFSRETQMKFLKFVTGCSRGPLLGFKFLEPLFCIQRAAGSATEEALDRLPTAATCMNLLKLPPYRSKQQLEQKLLYAINADAGFDLS